MRKQYCLLPERKKETYKGPINLIRFKSKVVCKKYLCQDRPGCRSL